MDRLKFMAVCTFCTLPLLNSAAQAASPDAADTIGTARWQDFIGAAAQQFGIPESWISGVMQAESRGRTTLNGKPITSVAGAMGLMQIMPKTYRSLRQQYGFGSDAYDPKNNIFAGAAYLRQMYEHYGYPSLFAAYNAGPARLNDFLQRGRALPRETLNYVGSIVPGADIGLSQSAVPVSAAPASVAAPTNSAGSLTPGDALFFVRNSAAGNAVAQRDAAPDLTKSRVAGVGLSPANSAALFVPLSATGR